MQQRSAHISVVGDNELSREGLKRVLAEAQFTTRCLALADLADRLGDLEDEPRARPARHPPAAWSAVV